MLWRAIAEVDRVKRKQKWRENNEGEAMRKQKWRRKIRITKKYMRKGNLGRKG